MGPAVKILRLEVEEDLRWLPDHGNLAAFVVQKIHNPKPPEVYTLPLATASPASLPLG